jgi:hypothetical protein
MGQTNEQGPIRTILLVGVDFPPQKAPVWERIFFKNTETNPELVCLNRKV